MSICRFPFEQPLTGCRLSARGYVAFGNEAAAWLRISVSADQRYWHLLQSLQRERSEYRQQPAGGRSTPLPPESFPNRLFSLMPRHDLGALVRRQSTLYLRAGIFAVENLQEDEGGALGPAAACPRSLSPSCRGSFSKSSQLAQICVDHWLGTTPDQKEQGFTAPPADWMPGTESCSLGDGQGSLRGAEDRGIANIDSRLGAGQLGARLPWSGVRYEARASFIRASPAAGVDCITNRLAGCC